MEGRLEHQSSFEKNCFLTVTVEIKMLPVTTSLNILLFRRHWLRASVQYNGDPTIFKQHQKWEMCTHDNPDDQSPNSLKMQVIARTWRNRANL